MPNYRQRYLPRYLDRRELFVSMRRAVKEILREFAETAYDSFEFCDTVEDSPRRDPDVATAGNVLKSRPGNNSLEKSSRKKNERFESWTLVTRMREKGTARNSGKRQSQIGESGRQTF
jgi:hypothetical protein